MSQSRAENGIMVAFFYPFIGQKYKLRSSISLFSAPSSDVELGNGISLQENAWRIYPQNSYLDSNLLTRVEFIFQVLYLTVYFRYERMYSVSTSNKHIKFDELSAQVAAIADAHAYSFSDVLLSPIKASWR